MRSLPVVAGLSILLIALPSQAQFATPVPLARAADVVRDEELRDLFVRYLRRTLPDEQRRLFDRDSLPASAIDLAAMHAAFCLERKEEPACSASQPSSALALLGRKPMRPSITREALAYDWPIAHTRAELADYMRLAGDSAGASLLSQFSTNVSDKEAYVTTSLISGLTGRFLLAINYAAVVVKSDEAEAQQRETVEDLKANVMRMVNNGGTLTMRLLAPIGARSGASNSDASSIYATVGFLGSGDETDKLSFAASLVAESMWRISVRDPLAGSTHIGDVLLGARFGTSYSNPGIVDPKKKFVTYGQLAVGLVQSSKLSLSVLLNWVATKTHRDYMPPVMLNLSALR